MSRLLLNSAPAERAHGCEFAEKFNSTTEIEANDGTISGTLTFENNGAEIDDTNNIKHDIPSHLFNNMGFSIVMKFIPNWNGSDGIIHFIFDTDGPSNTRLWKMTNNDLRLVLNGTSVDIPYATWSPYYYQGQMNTLVIACESGKNNVWLNNGLILDNDGTSWATLSHSQINIGTDSTGNNSASGLYREFKLFSKRITGLDAQMYATNRMFNYMQYLIEYWPMRTSDESGSTTVGVKGKTLSLVGGTTKISGSRGYMFNGSTGYMECTDSGFDFGDGTSDSPGTMVGLFQSKRGLTTPFFNKHADSWAPSNYRFGTFGSGAMLAYFYDKSSNGFRGRIASTTSADKVGVWTSLGWTYDGSGDPHSGSRIYMDGSREDDSNAANGNPYVAMENVDDTAFPLTIGRLMTQYLDGGVAGFMAFNIELSAIQMSDVNYRLRNSLQDDY